MDDAPPVDADAAETLLREYLLAVENGAMPRIDDFALRLQDPRSRSRLLELHEQVLETQRLFPIRTRPQTMLVGRYRLVDELGSGSFGRVWLAADERLGGKRVAVKVLNGLAAMGDVQAELHREMSALARAEHPGIVRILDVGSHEGNPFLVLELVEGTTLAAMIAALSREDTVVAPPDPDAVVQSARLAASDVELAREAGNWWRFSTLIVTQLLDALRAAHDVGVIHRDIKPGNVMLRSDGQVVLLDFGIARIVDAGSEASRSGLTGTLAYLAPEQACGSGAGFEQQSDVYQAGRVLYELTTLRPAIPRECGLARTLELAKEASFDRPRVHAPSLPPGLETICLHALERDPTRRYATARAFREDLLRFLSDEPPHFVRNPPLAHARRDPNDIEGERFDIRETLHESARCTRHRAFDRKLECEVMIEYPGPAVAANMRRSTAAVAMREARALAKVVHPQVVRLRELTEIDGRHALVLDLPPGESLEDLLRRDLSATGSRLDPGQVIRLGRELATAAHAVHEAMVVHRGICAENVFIDPSTGAARLSGFTFAKPTDRGLVRTSIDYQGGLRAEPALLGLPDYIAPEQMDGQAVDHRGDIFALGCLLYRCATGRSAFDVDRSEFVLPPDAHTIADGMPRGLSDTIRTCLARVPSQRFQSMIQLGDALEALDRPSADAPRRRMGVWLWIGAGLLIVLLLYLYSAR